MQVSKPAFKCINEFVRKQVGVLLKLYKLYIYLNAKLNSKR